MADLADHAFGHALAVVGDESAAVEVARRGLLRGGRSRVSVLGHTRAVALAAEVGDAASPAPESVVEAALALAGRRPAVERAVIDLEVRHGLTRNGFARALGLPPAEASSRASEVAAAWTADLDPALLAWLGPGECPALAELLGPSPISVDALLAAAGAVAAHAEACEPCGDRLRAMVSVRSIVGQLPLPAAPESVRAAARSARRRPPVPPPALGSQRSRAWARLAVAGGALMVAAALVVAVVGAVVRHSGRNERVDALTALPPGHGALALSATTFDATTDTVTLTNRSPKRVRWDSAATVPWLRTVPRSGVLAPGASVVVALHIADAAPEGDIAASLSFSSPDGSTVSMAGSGTIERAPDVAAHRDGCEVMATAEDEGRVAAVVLHWRVGAGGAEQTDDMGPAASNGSGYHGALPPTATLWWVTAADARGNISHTPDEAIAPPAC